MSKNLAQVFITNPITSNAASDLMYFSATGTIDAAMTYANFAAQFGAPYTAAALTKTDDTNVTLTLGGTPATALLHAASLTLGWTGTLAYSRGGLGAAITASTGGIFYSGASAAALLAGTATASLPLLSGSSAAPTWGAFALSLGGALTTAGALTTVGAFGVTFTFTNTTGVTFPTSGTLATTAGTVANATNIAITDDTTTNASMLPVWVTTNTGNLPAKVSSTKITFNPSTATLTTTIFAGALSGNATTATTATNATNVATTATNSTNASFFPTFVASGTSGNQGVDTATGLTFNPSTNTLTTTTFSGALNGNATTATSATTAGNGFTWNDVAGTSQAAVANNGYIISNAGQTTVTIPATIAEGAVLAIAGKGAAGWILQANTGQVIHLGNQASSSAGTLTSTNQWDSVTIVCVTANTTFTATAVLGALTVA